MPPLFNTEPVRRDAHWGQASFGIKRSLERWPPPDRDPVDIALVAASVLSISGRLRSRLRRAAQRAGVPTDVLLLLLLFSEATVWFRIVDIAELLGVGTTTASRLATRAEAAGLIDKYTSAIDHREVGCRLSVAGRAAVTECLDSLRPHATAVLRPPDREWIVRARELLKPSSRPDLPKQDVGWRAGIRIGMWSDE